MKRKRIVLTAKLMGFVRSRLPAFVAVSRGQAMVEFTLIFILMLVVAWIPADFGLAFYTGQLARNAAREGSRIAAADPSITVGTVTCTMPTCLSGGNILKETGSRISSALMPGATISVTYPAPGGMSGTCNQQVRVTVTGQYRYFHYGLLGYFGIDTPNTNNITRTADMRWEYQPGCSI